MKAYQKDLGKALLIKITLLALLAIFFHLYKQYNAPKTVAYEEIYK